MDIEGFKDYLLETSSLARRLYGVKLLVNYGPTDTSKWFLFNYENLKYKIDLREKGVILDIGAYRGVFSSKLMARHPENTYWLYEPIPDYFKVCLKRFKQEKNIILNQVAVTSDGRNLLIKIDGLRSRKVECGDARTFEHKSRSIQEIFNSLSEIELLKMNIEGMEFECLEQLVSSNSLIKARYLLIQFHEFEVNSHQRREDLHKVFEKDFDNLFCYEWMWELWIRKNY
jgi:FkbM family methyltransferase